MVVGENATRCLTEGGGSSELKVKDYVSPLSALHVLYGDKVKYAKGYVSGRSLYENEDVIPQEELDKLRSEAVAMAKDADVVIYVGGLNKNAWQDCESTDRREYSLPFGQNELIEELIKANPNIVIANITGNAYEMPWIEKALAVFASVLSLHHGRASLADVVAGKVNPSGKLPYSIPVKLEDCGANSFGVESYPVWRQRNYRVRNIWRTYLWGIAGTTPRRFPRSSRSVMALATQLSHTASPCCRQNRCRKVRPLL